MIWSEMETKQLFTGYPCIAALTMTQRNFSCIYPLAMLGSDTHKDLMTAATALERHFSKAVERCEVCGHPTRWMNQKPLLRRF
jgi:hypothetical protein